MGLATFYEFQIIRLHSPSTVVSCGINSVTNPSVTITEISITTIIVTETVTESYSKLVLSFYF